ncbi:hypothetical protein ABK040_005588 [Willaertia magna]
MENNNLLSSLTSFIFPRVFSFAQHFTIPTTTSSSSSSSDNNNNLDNNNHTIIIQKRNDKNGNNNIHSIIGERDLFDEIDPNTLQIKKFNPIQENLIYSKFNNNLQQDHSINNTLQNINVRKDNLQKKLSFSNKNVTNNLLNKENNEIIDKFLQQNNLIDNMTIIQELPLLEPFNLTKNSNNYTRRVTRTTFKELLKEPNTIDELYLETLPNLRNSLQKLKQIGNLKFTKNVNSNESLIKFTKSQKNTLQKNTKKDTSLQFLQPKQWKGTLPNTAIDDIQQNCQINSNFGIFKNKINKNEKIKYFIHLQQSYFYPFKILCKITMSQFGKFILQNEVILEFNENNKLNIYKENEINFNCNEGGTISLFVEFYILLESKKLINTFGPLDIHVLQ